MNARDYIDDKIANNPKEWKGLRNMSIDDVAQLMEEYAQKVKTSITRRCTCEPFFRDTYEDGDKEYCEYCDLEV